MSVVAALEAAVYAATRAALGDAPLATAKLTAAIVDRSLRYTSDRAHLAAPTDKVGDLAARAAFFTIADAMKIAVPLGELAARGAMPAGRPLRVLDLGAGCGAMSLGLVATLELPVSITAIDRDAAALAIAATAVRELAKARGLAVEITTRVDDATRAPLPAADLVVIGTMLNELAEGARLDVVRRALATISGDGAVIIIEPALRETTRALHVVRDTLLAEAAAHVFAPCTRGGVPCPAYAADDWCHEHRTAILPPRTAELARLTHLRDDGLKFSYLVLRKDPHPLAAPGAWRIVDSPRGQKGKVEVLACSDAGRLPIRLLRRNRTDANRIVERLERGDVVVVEAVPDDDRVEVAPHTQVMRVIKAGR
ncbi:MAG TPA: small ribosomal subunit Rsm22 family protein [Kofleriaceae bacterium]|nr:small ribosomal subunit Rsm22 family protein [Kofleriaceae bacterium]